MVAVNGDINGKGGSTTVAPVEEESKPMKYLHYKGNEISQHCIVVVSATEELVPFKIIFACMMLNFKHHQSARLQEKSKGIFHSLPK